MGQHAINFPEVKASTDVVKEKGEEASVTFTVPNTHGEMEYYDSVANHAELGMRGVLLVGTRNNRQLLLRQALVIRW
jgi:plastocyanin